MARLVLAAAALFASACGAASDARSVTVPSLSPTAWPAGVLSMFQNLTTRPCYPSCPHPLASGEGAVAGSTNALAVQSGAFALQQGGSAMDACLATAAAQPVLAAGAYVSLAGIMQIVYYSASDDRVYHLDGAWNTPRRMPPSIPPVNTTAPPGAAVLVPGFMPALEKAAQRFARFPVSSLLEPALFFAEQGFVLDALLPSLIRMSANAAVLERTPEGRALFTSPATGSWYAAGDVLRQPQVAGLLRNVSERGVAAGMMAGAWASDAAALIGAQGGTLSEEDFQSYTAQWREAVGTPFTYGAASGGVAEVWGPGGAGWGGVSLGEQVLLLQTAGIALWPGSVPIHANATTLFWMAQFSRWSELVSAYSRLFNQSVTHAVLSPYFPGINFTDAGRLTRDNAQRVWTMLSAEGGVAAFHHAECRLHGVPAAQCPSAAPQNSPSTVHLSDFAQLPGEVAEVVQALWRRGAAGSDARGASDGAQHNEGRESQRMHGVDPRVWALSSDPASGHSDSVVAADADGNVCALMHTINSMPWGTGLFVHGVALNHAASIMSAYVRSAGPSSRVATGERPALVLQPARGAGGRTGTAGRVMGAVSVVGKSDEQTPVQHVLELLLGGGTPKDVIDAPALLIPASSSPSRYRDAMQVLRAADGGLSASVVDEVRALGQPMIELTMQEMLEVMEVPVALWARSSGPVSAAIHPLPPVNSTGGAQWHAAAVANCNGYAVGVELSATATAAS